MAITGLKLGQCLCSSHQFMVSLDGLHQCSARARPWEVLQIQLLGIKETHQMLCLYTALINSRIKRHQILDLRAGSTCVFSWENSLRWVLTLRSLFGGESSIKFSFEKKRAKPTKIIEVQPKAELNQNWAWYPKQTSVMPFRQWGS